MSKDAFQRNAIFLAASLRALAIGFISVYLGIYLAQQGIDPFGTGLVIAIGLIGNTGATLFVSFFGTRFGRRTLLLTLSLLMALGGILLLFGSGLHALLLASFIGMVNGMGRDRSSLRVLDQSILPDLVPPEKRTFVFALYNVSVDLATAFGAALTALPELAAHALHLSPQASAFGLYAFLFLASELAYLWTPSSHTIPKVSEPSTQLSSVSRKKVWHLALLFMVDSLGGGFLTSSLIAYWFLVRFHPSTGTIAILFFVARVLNSVSNFVAVWIARKIGLIRTMVFTHLPSSLFLIGVAFAPTLSIAIILFLIRESMVQMDVPTRESYTMAIVTPEERPFAAGLTSTTRNLGWAITPILGGAGMAAISPAFALVAGSILKILYDIILYAQFRHLKPPEEGHT